MRLLGGGKTATNLRVGSLKGPKTTANIWKLFSGSRDSGTALLLATMTFFVSRRFHVPLSIVGRSQLDRDFGVFGAFVDGFGVFLDTTEMKNSDDSL